MSGGERGVEAALPAEQRNYLTLLGRGISRRVGNELSSDSLVLPFLYTTLGGSVIFAGVLTPMFVIGRLFAQLFGAEIIARARRTKYYLGLSSVVTASILLILAGASGSLSVAALPVAFIAAAAILGTGHGFGNLVYYEMIGRLLSDRRRVSVLFTLNIVSGLVVVVTTLVAQALLGPEIAQETHSTAYYDHLLVAGAAMLIVSSLLVLPLKEIPRHPSDSPLRYLPAMRAEIGETLTLSWFPAFLRTRLMFLSVELMLPFFSVHAATYHGDYAPSLAVFVIAASLGLSAGGYAWKVVGRHSLTRVLGAAPLVAFLAAALALANHLVDGVQSPFLHATIIFCLAFAGSGTFDGANAYIVRSAGESQRPFCLGISSFLTGVVGIVIALFAGLIAEGAGVLVVLGVMASFNIAASLSAFRLPDVRAPVVQPAPA